MLNISDNKNILFHYLVLNHKGLVHLFLFSQMCIHFNTAISSVMTMFCLIFPIKKHGDILQAKTLQHIPAWWPHLIRTELVNILQIETSMVINSLIIGAKQKAEVWEIECDIMQQACFHVNEEFIQYLLKLSSSDTRLPLCHHLILKGRSGLTQE